MAGGPPQAKATLSYRSWDERWGSTTSTKSLMEKAELPKESGDPKRLSSVECKPLPLPQLREGRGAPSRGDVIEAEITDVNGQAAEKVLLEVLEVQPAQEVGIVHGVVGLELGDYAVQILGMGKDQKSSWSTSVRLGNLKGYKAALHREEWTVVPRGAVRGVDGESAKANARTGQPFSDKFLEAVLPIQK